MQTGNHYKMYSLEIGLETSQRDKAVYGNQDQRQNLDQLKPPQLDRAFIEKVKNQAQSIACLILKDYLKKRAQAGWRLKIRTPTLAQSCGRRI